MTRLRIRLAAAALLPCFALASAPRGARAAMVGGVLSASPSSSVFGRAWPSASTGRPAPKFADAYSAAERAGGVEDERRIGAQGWIDHFRDGYLFGAPGSRVTLRLKAGFKAAPGELFSVIRLDGPLSDARGVVGTLVQNVGVVRVTRIHGRRVDARVVAMAVNLLEGDWVRPRAPQALAYRRLLARAAGAKPLAGPLRGEVVGVLPPSLFAGDGQFVYVDLGVRQGVLPGARLRVISHPQQEGYGADDPDSVEPMTRIGLLQPPGDDLRQTEPTGPIAVLTVVNATAKACAARVSHCLGEVRLGDEVRTP